MSIKYFAGLAVVFATVTTLQLHAQTDTLVATPPSPGDYAVVERGPDWKVMQKTTVVNGVTNVHRYTELATGLNYTTCGAGGGGQYTEKPALNGVTITDL